MLAHDDIRPAGQAAGTIVLVHGFATNRGECWRRLGWYGAFERRGWRVVAPDLRGHGESDKPHDAASYAPEAMAADILELIDGLGLERFDLFGYSMGAGLASAVALARPGQVSHLVLGGVGDRLFGHGERSDLASAMRADDAASIVDPLARGFRLFADDQGEDRLALAACAERSGASPLTAADLPRFAMPVLVIAGANDEIAGDPAALAAALPPARSVVIAGCDHFSAIPHALTKAAVFDFLEDWLDEFS